MQVPDTVHGLSLSADLQDALSMQPDIFTLLSDSQARLIPSHKACCVASAVPAGAEAHQGFPFCGSAGARADAVELLRRPSPSFTT